MLIIERQNVRLTGWPAPGILTLILEDGAFAFYDTASHSERLLFQANLQDYVSPIMCFSNDGRWLLAHFTVWDLAATATALSAGTQPVPDPISRYSADDAYHVHCLYALSQDGRYALRCVGRDLTSPVIQQLLSVPEFEVLVLL